METQDSINARAAHVQTALQDAFGVKGKTLAVALRRTGRRLPKRLRADAQALVDAQTLGGQPKMLRRVDGAALSAAETRVLNHLGTIDRTELRKSWWLGIAGLVALNVLVVLGAFVGWMVWAGHL